MTRQKSLPLVVPGSEKTGDITRFGYNRKVDTNLWELPDDKSTKKKILKLLRGYERDDKPLEAGLCCTRLSHMFKQIGPLNKSAYYGQRAVEFLRRTDDRAALSRALRAACVPFDTSIHQQEFLRESLELARACGSKREEAYTIYRFTRAFTPTAEQWGQLYRIDKRGKSSRFRDAFQAMRDRFRDGHTVEEALMIFEEIRDVEGIAMCLVSLGIERNPHDRALFERAIKLFSDVGDHKSATRTKMMADAFAPKP